MKSFLILIISTFCFCEQIGFLGRCGMAPKYRPLECFKNSVLEEDLNELSEVLLKFKNNGDDSEFANILGDMIDKKKFREKKNFEQEEKRIGACGMHPKYLPVECYEQNILRRDKNIIRDAYNKYHEKNLKKLSEIYRQLIEKKYFYYNQKNKEIV